VHLSVQIEGAGKLCGSYNIPHVINNAYGVQSAWICSRVTRACRVARVDVIIQSTDKNFMVPVGGAIAAAPKGGEGGLLRDMAARYPGRAGVSAHLDLLMTLLHLGQQGWLKLLDEREQLFEYCKVLSIALSVMHAVHAAVFFNSQSIVCFAVYTYL
jgi:O-phospho-L-seryl-tRNASec:L-selenocysteinyl-tRNA synthase